MLTSLSKSSGELGEKKDFELTTEECSSRLTVAADSAEKTRSVSAEAAGSIWDSFTRLIQMEIGFVPDNRTTRTWSTLRWKRSGVVCGFSSSCRL